MTGPESDGGYVLLSDRLKAVSDVAGKLNLKGAEAIAATPEGRERLRAESARIRTWAREMLTLGRQLTKAADGIDASLRKGKRWGFRA